MITAKLITAKLCKKIISLLPKTISAGSYARDHDRRQLYRDLDLVSMLSAQQIINILSLNYKIEVLKHGNKYIDLLLNDKYRINVWLCNKTNFYKIYLNHYLKKEHLITIHKKLQI